MKPKLLVTFSGGKTSAYMSYMLKRDYSDKYDLRFIFANTGQEHEKTLEFVDRCDREFGLDLVWVEAVVHHDERKGTGYRIVSFESASRNGEPFEEVIKKYGIPNKAYPHCNRELKLAPIHSWAKESLVNYLTAIGIRADESHRVRADAEKEGIAYPLCDWFLTDKIDVNNFWEDQSFNLEILEHQGNCKTCWKKSDRKLFMLAKENREYFDFFNDMEKNYGLSGAREDGWEPRVFFRSERSTETLLKQADLYNENNTQISFFDLDENSGCTEECTPY